jgi:hypothetical protein
MQKTIRNTGILGVQLSGARKVDVNLGQHGAPIGIRCSDKSDRQVNQEALDSFTRAWEEIRFGNAIAGREW